MGSKYTVGSLFSGIGGIDYAFSEAGFNILFQVEIDDFCRKVLSKHAPRYWPHSTQFTDIRTVSRDRLPTVDILVGGFPCQDVSLAGKRSGVHQGTRSGLWLEFARIIGDLRPRAVLLENVPGILTLDGCNVIADLAALGYVGHWGIISAGDAGAPHRRERWFCVAYATSQYDGQRFSQYAYHQWSDDTEWERLRFEFGGDDRSLADTIGDGNAQRRNWQTQSHPKRYSSPRKFRRHNQQFRVVSYRESMGNAASIRRKHYQPFTRSTHAGKGKRRLLKSQRAGVRQLESRLGRIPHGLSARLDRHQFPAPPGSAQHPAEPPRVTTHAQDRAKRLKALGNSVVPQAIYPIALEIRRWLDEN